MRNYTAVYVSPHFEIKDGGYHVTGWKFERLLNGKLVAWGQGYETPEEARKAGEEWIDAEDEEEVRGLASEHTEE